MKIKMKSNIPFSVNGINVETLETGKVYEATERMEEVLVKQLKVAEIVKEDNDVTKIVETIDAVSDSRTSDDSEKQVESTEENIEEMPDEKSLDSEDYENKGKGKKKNKKK